MSDFDLNHLQAALHAAARRIRGDADRNAAIQIAMDEFEVPDSDKHIVSRLTAVLVHFGNEIRAAEKDAVPLRGIEVS